MLYDPALSRLSSVTFRVDRGGKEARLLRLESAVRRDPDSVKIASRSAFARPRRTFVKV